MPPVVPRLPTPAEHAVDESTVELAEEPKALHQIGEAVG